MSDAIGDQYPSSPAPDPGHAGSAPEPTNSSGNATAPDAQIGAYEWYRRGAALHADGHPAAAAEALAHAVTAEPGASSIREAWARALFDSRRYSEALAQFLVVIEHIGLGDDSYDLPRIVEAAKAAHAHKFIQELAQGYETRIGPMGTYLKHDQQYRIGLARAFLHDPSIVILEEPKLALDEDVKDLIDDSVTRLAARRTMLILPHRLSTIRSSDLVLTIQNGRLESSGTPRDLQASSKLFRHLQYVEFNQFATGEIEAGQMNA